MHLPLFFAFSAFFIPVRSTSKNQRNMCSPTYSEEVDRDCKSFCYCLQCVFLFEKPRQIFVNFSTHSRKMKAMCLRLELPFSAS